MIGLVIIPHLSGSVVTCSFVNLPVKAQEGETLQLFRQQVTCVIVQKMDINLLRLSVSTNFYHSVHQVYATAMIAVSTVHA